VVALKAGATDPDGCFRPPTDRRQAGIRPWPDGAVVNTTPASRLPAVGPPVFVLGERPAAMELVRALGDTPTLSAMPANRLLSDLVSAVERCLPDLEPLAVVGRGGHVPPASWYVEVQAARLRQSGKSRTVEFSGVSVLRLCDLFPTAQFMVVHQLKRAIPRSRRLPALGQGRILEIDSAQATTPETLGRALAFLGETPEPVVLDLSDRATAQALTPAFQ
jgi:hypothetical protein